MICACSRNRRRPRAAHRSECSTRSARSPISIAGPSHPYVARGSLRARGCAGWLATLCPIELTPLGGDTGRCGCYAFDHVRKPSPHLRRGPRGTPPRSVPALERHRVQAVRARRRRRFAGTGLSHSHLGRRHRRARRGPRSRVLRAVARGVHRARRGQRRDGRRDHDGDEADAAGRSSACGWRRRRRGPRVSPHDAPRRPRRGDHLRRAGRRLRPARRRRRGAIRGRHDEPGRMPPRRSGRRALGHHQAAHEGRARRVRHGRTDDPRHLARRCVREPGHGRLLDTRRHARGRPHRR